MKRYCIDIHPYLKQIHFSVRNGKRFEDYLIKGEYHDFLIDIDDYDLYRVKNFAIKYGNVKSSNNGNWYAHCNGYAMDLCVTNSGKYISINTYRPYGRANK